MINEIKNDGILRGYTTMQTAYEVKNYPYGFRLRTSIFYWIETKPGHGDRFCSYTINPKTGKANKPKFGTYSPFLYMYINEDGHVKTGGINAYDMEEFRARFYFIIVKIGVEFLTEEQKNNLRVNYYQHTRGNAPYIAAKYLPETQPIFIEWVKATLKHIRECDFAELVNHPEEPTQDNPTGEVKMTVTEYRTA